MTHGSNEVGRNTGARSLNQTVALAFGVVYALVGVIGFFWSKTFATPAPSRNGQIIGLFQVNVLHNLVHLAIAVALIAAANTYTTARGANLAVGVTYVLVGILGLFLAGDHAANIIAVNQADNVLHLVSGALLTGVALAADKARTARA